MVVGRSFYIILGLGLVLSLGAPTAKTQDKTEALFWQTADCAVEEEMWLYLEEYSKGAYVEEARECLKAIQQAGSDGPDTESDDVQEQGQREVDETPQNEEKDWQAPDGYRAYLTASESGGTPLEQPQTRFSCEDKIYGVLEIDRPEDGTDSRTLRAVWLNPSDAIQERTKYQFQLHNGRARVWVWLKLHRAADSVLTEILSPSRGMEELEGEWELQVRINDILVGQRQFQVRC